MSIAQAAFSVDGDFPLQRRPRNAVPWSLFRVPQIPKLELVALVDLGREARCLLHAWWKLTLLDQGLLNMCDHLQEVSQLLCPVDVSEQDASCALQNDWMCTIGVFGLGCYEDGGNVDFGVVLC